MKKLAISILTVAFIVLLFANAVNAQLMIPAPCENECGPCGLTPGFWKHNLKVYLTSVYGEDLTNGKYSAAYDVKMTDQSMTDLLTNIKGSLVYLGAIPDTMTLQTLAEELLAALELPGSNMNRTYAANWFNYWMGFTPY
jgi:hypothetical protein